ncbi:unnamed protein product [Vitrella brassicaformis CCMP3155]|uniref:Uncharacterized protein n=1 Tax=Vitrella brassicaformis (strain CCMP3155) TaxID=1169540 RepID=A0A0G4FZB0_VITBC|nr:unnamed protein product [Vitrella brassicaformis CCMP3155]|eukprot:CEM20504.1 unnamed protein product [Vitrella brassicaformis CCMP3155]
MIKRSPLLTAAPLLVLIAIAVPSNALNRTAALSSRHSLTATLRSGHHGGFEVAEDPCLMPDNWKGQWEQIIREDARRYTASSLKHLTFNWREPVKTRGNFFSSETPIDEIIADLPPHKEAQNFSACSIRYQVQLTGFGSLIHRPQLAEYGYCGRQQGGRVCACVSGSWQYYAHETPCVPLELEPTVEQDKKITQLGTKLASLLPTAGSNKKSWREKCSTDDDCYTPPLVSNRHAAPVRCFKREKKATHGFCKLRAGEGEPCDNKKHVCKPRFECSGFTALFGGTGECKPKQYM